MKLNELEKVEEIKNDGKINIDTLFTPKVT